jgi:hypothetical protein
MPGNSIVFDTPESTPAASKNLMSECRVAWEAGIRTMIDHGLWCASEGILAKRGARLPGSDRVPSGTLGLLAGTRKSLAPEPGDNGPRTESDFMSITNLKTHSSSGLTARREYPRPRRQHGTTKQAHKSPRPNGLRAGSFHALTHSCLEGETDGFDRFVALPFQGLARTARIIALTVTHQKKYEPNECGGTKPEKDRRARTT